MIEVLKAWLADSWLGVFVTGIAGSIVGGLLLLFIRRMVKRLWPKLKVRAQYHTAVGLFRFLHKAVRQYGPDILEIETLVDQSDKMPFSLYYIRAQVFLVASVLIFIFLFVSTGLFLVLNWGHYFWASAVLVALTILAFFGAVDDGIKAYYAHDQVFKDLENELAEFFGRTDYALVFLEKGMKRQGRKRLFDAFLEQKRAQSGETAD